MEFERNNKVMEGVENKAEKMQIKRKWWNEEEKILKDRKQKEKGRRREGNKKRKQWDMIK